MDGRLTDVSKCYGMKMLVNSVEEGLTDVGKFYGKSVGEGLTDVGKFYGRRIDRC